VLMSVKLNGSSMHLVIVFYAKVNMLVRLLKLHSLGPTVYHYLHIVLVHCALLLKLYVS